MFINTNVSALTAYRNLARQQQVTAEATEQLASGLRINKAADDAAGLAISEGLTSQVNGLGQGMRNAQDGINLVQTADGALAESQDILQRMRTLAVQAANDSNDSASRADMQAEVGQLEQQLDAIAHQTAFAGQPLLDGTFTGKLIQVGSDADDTIPVDLQGAIVEPGHDAIPGHAASPSYLSLSGPADNDWVGSAADPANGLGVVAIADDGHTAQVDLSQVTDAKSAYQAFTTQLAGTDFGAYFNDETGSIEVYTRFDSAHDIEMTGGNIAPITNGMTAWEYGSSLYVNAGLDSRDPIDAGTNGQVPDLRKITDMTLTLDGHAIDFPISTPLPDDDDTTDLAGLVRTAIQSDPATKDLYSVTAYGYDAPHDYTEYENGEPTPEHDPGSHGGVEIRSLYPNHYPDEQVPMSWSFSNHGTTVFTATGGDNGTEPAGVDSSPGAWVAEQPAEPTRYAGFDSVGLGVSGGVDLTTQDKAEASITVIDKAIRSLSNTRAYLGATQNRLTHAVNTASVAQENLDTATSYIRDADMAQAAASLTTSQVLSNAGTAMLSQATKAPQSVLALLSM